MSVSVVIGAGGTGGHIFPGLAVAEAIRHLDPGARVTFVGTSRGLEGKIIPERGYDLRLVDMRPFTRRLGVEPVIALGAWVRSTLQARRILRRERADVVVGMGGYPALPVVTAAWLARLPRLVHESGAVPGLANKVAARLTPNLAVAFEAALPHLRARGTARVVGMPLDRAIAGFDRDRLRPEGRRAFGVSDDATVVLVLGGSQGAERLNRAALGLAERWRDRPNATIVLKAGAGHLDALRAEIEARGLADVLHPVGFIDRMDLAYAAADVAVCRAGAGTVAELASVGLPAVLVPYPHAPDDHQTKNAMTLVEAGAAYVVADAEANGERIAPLVEGIVDDAGRLETMRSAGRSLARGDAAVELARWALDLAARGRRREGV